jgi:hypothetical protein
MRERRMLLLKLRFRPTHAPTPAHTRTTAYRCTAINYPRGRCELERCASFDCGLISKSVRLCGVVVNRARNEVTNVLSERGLRWKLGEGGGGRDKSHWELDRRNERKD